MFKDETFNQNGLLSSKAISILKNKGLFSKSLDKKKATVVDEVLVESSVADLLSKEIKKSEENVVQGTIQNTLPSLPAQLLIDDFPNTETLNFLHDTVMSLQDKRLSGFGLMDTEDVLLEMALFDDLLMNRNKVAGGFLFWFSWGF